MRWREDVPGCDDDLSDVSRARRVLPGAADAGQSWHERSSYPYPRLARTALRHYPASLPHASE